MNMKIAVITMIAMMSFGAVSFAGDGGCCGMSAGECVAVCNATCPVDGVSIDTANSATAQFEGKEYNVCSSCVDAFNADAANLAAKVTVDAQPAQA